MRLFLHFIVLADINNLTARRDTWWNEASISVEITFAKYISTLKLKTNIKIANRIALATKNKLFYPSHTVRVFQDFLAIDDHFDMQMYGAQMCSWKG